MKEYTLDDLSQNVFCHKTSPLTKRYPSQNNPVTKRLLTKCPTLKRPM